MTFTLQRRASGVLLHPTSLPGPHAIGDLGPEAFRFVDFLAAAGQKWWQMLPVCPPDPWNSPYQSLSSFAGNTLLISLEELGVHVSPVESPRADFLRAAQIKETGFRQAFASFRPTPEFEAFRRTEKAWLDDYALFMALRKVHDNAAWTSWDPDLRSRKPTALKKAAKQFEDEIRYHEFLQFAFFRQWSAIKDYAHGKGIGLIGDLPIYVAHDSAEVWSNPDIFELDEQGRQTFVAGVPPDYFCETGQRWGNPLYRWDVLKRRKYDWWIARLQSILGRFDAVRLDHFIGFHRYWEIPAEAKTAQAGAWKKGPGSDFFKAVFQSIKNAQFIAEDLGSITPEVDALREEFDLPGMRVIQFMFVADPGVKKYQPHNFTRRLAVYTGTHDNDTIKGWFDSQAGFQQDSDAKRALRYAGATGQEPHWDMIRMAMMSVADTAVFPVQDLLGLGSDARMNRPGTDQGNWQWRLSAGALTPDVAARLRSLVELYDR
jgi:4-alpha-glucanotransferase